MLARKKNKKKKFFRRKTVRLAFLLLVMVGLVAMLASLIANDMPLYVKHKGMHLFPALSMKGYADTNTGRRRDREAGIQF